MIENDIEELESDMWKLKEIIYSLPYYLVGVNETGEHYVAIFSTELNLQLFVMSCRNKGKKGTFKKDSVMGEFDSYDVRRYYIPKDLPFDIEG